MNIDNIYPFIQNNALADIYLIDAYIGELIGIYSFDCTSNELRGFIVKVNEKSFNIFKDKAIPLSLESIYKRMTISDLPDVTQNISVVYVRNLGNACFKNKVSISKIIEKL